MRRVFWTFRRGAMIGVAAASVIGAGVLTWVFVAGQELWQLGTAHLAAILALAVLPVATLGAWALDRRAAREQGSVLEDNGLFERPAGVEVVEEEAETEAPVNAATDAKEPPRTRQVHPPHRRRHSRPPAGRKR